MNSNDHNASVGNDQSTLGNLKEQAGEKVSQVADTLKQEAVRREEANDVSPREVLVGGRAVLPHDTEIRRGAFMLATF